MLNRKAVLLTGLLIIAVLGTGCGAAKKEPTAGKLEGGRERTADGRVVVSKEAREDFEKVLTKLDEAEKDGLSSDECTDIAKEFNDLADEYDGMVEAVYNVGAIYRKCGMHDKAKDAFEETLKLDPKHQLSLTHMAVYKLEAGKTQEAKKQLIEAINLGKNRLDAVPAYTNLAGIQRKEGNAKKGRAAAKFYDDASLNLRRALAIESKYMPALYELAMLYYDQAVYQKKKSLLTLAKLVCDQATKLDPEYGLIFHVIGQMNLEEGNLVDALKNFEAAFTKDPTLFESYMNFAAINLNFRGYQQAKAAFERAIALQPNSYDAHIGLGVALRGLQDFAGARAEYDRAKAIDPKRTDYIFNLGVLVMDYENQGTPEDYAKGKQVFKQFLDDKNTTKNKKMTRDPDGRGPQKSWVAKAKHRIKKSNEAIKQIKEALAEMAEMQRLQEEMAKREAEAKAMMEKAKELEEQEASGAAGGEDVDWEAAEEEAATGESK